MNKKLQNLYLIFCLFAGFFVTCENVYGQGGNFLSAIHDVPLMEELYEIKGESLAFDKPSGRIINAIAVSDALTPVQIYNFYDMTLPQLGWNVKDAGLYEREGEELNIEAKQSGEITMVKYALTP